MNANLIQATSRLVLLMLTLMGGISSAQCTVLTLGAYRYDFARFPGFSGQNEPFHISNCGYGGVHKYLYAECDPVDNDDPNGHDIGDMLGVLNIGFSFFATINPVSGSGVSQFLSPIAEKVHGFAYHVWASKKGGSGRLGIIGTEKGKTIVEDATGITKFKADITDLKNNSWRVNRVAFYGHGDGGGTLGDPQKAQIGFGNKTHSPYKNALYGPDLEDLFNGIVSPRLTVQLYFCASLDDKDTIDMFRKLAPQADIWGEHGVCAGWGDYGDTVFPLEHYDQ